MARINAYVVGGSTGYANWLIQNPDGPNGQIVHDMQSADIVVFTGGGDVHPSFYNRAVNPRTSAIDPGSSHLSRDVREWELMQTAIDLRKPIWGTCRGLQLMCTKAGGDLIQHVNHGGWNHDITFYDGTVVETNTIHHQMIYPFEKLKQGEDYFIVANSLGLSKVHQGETSENLVMPKNADGVILEPESAFFPKINGFGQQSHLEMQSYSAPVVRLTRKLVEFQIRGELSYVLENNISFQDILKPDFSVEKVIKGSFILNQ